MSLAEIRGTEKLPRGTRPSGERLGDAAIVLYEAAKEQSGGDAAGAEPDQEPSAGPADDSEVVDAEFEEK